MRRTTIVDVQRDRLKGQDMIVGCGVDEVIAREHGTSFGKGEVTLEIDSGESPTVRTATVAGRVIDGLVGQSVSSGFRRKVSEILPDSAESLDLRLLDDVPIMVMIAGYGDRASGQNVGDDRLMLRNLDVCAGWAEGSSAIVGLRQRGETPFPIGPLLIGADVAPPDRLCADHPQGPGQVRRLRRIEVWRDRDVPKVVAMFRDSHKSANAGVVTVIHEYSLTATLDVAARVVDTIEARPVVVPWGDCSGAASSSRRLIRQPLGELNEIVKRFVGPSTCTHLNDLLRSLVGLPALLERLD